MADQPTQTPTQTQTQRGGPSTSQILAVITLFPIGGVLLTLSGLTLTGTVIGLALATPLFVVCSPVLVPAVFIIGLAVTGFLTSSALGLTGFSSLTWIMNYMRRVYPVLCQKLDQIKRRVQEAAGHAEQKSKELGQGFQSKAQETGQRK